MIEPKRRVAICEDTGKKVLQIQYGKDWLCLHNETEEEDEKEAAEFEKSLE